MPTVSAFKIARPFAWMAALAFLAGFVTYLALGHPATAASHHSAQAITASGPSSDEWNLPKKI
jgi:hypothetical protein